MEVCPGMRVVVPFGKGNSPKEGVVISLSHAKPLETTVPLKEILRPVEGYAALTAEQIALAEEIAKRYHCTMAEALRLMIPAQMRGGRVHEKTVNVAQLAMDGEELCALKEYARKRAPAQLAVLELLEQVGAMGTADLYAANDRARSGLPPLVRRGAVKIVKERVRRMPFLLRPQQRDEAPILSQAQKTAANQICGKMQTGGFEEFLLHGVTGSGKTEVYLAAIQKCLALGKGAIVLVPEISLTPQMVQRFQSRFGETVAVLHSRLSAGERFDEWRRIRTGEAKVVIGPRSAVFAPLDEIGLIVIDEEHEQSYRSEMHPQYETEEIARWRCEFFHCPLVLGSATPSVCTYYRCVEKKELTLLELPERVGEGELPKVELCDMRQELAQGNRSIFSKPLYEAIRQRLEKNEQVMLFINLRGYAKFVMCRGCGYVLECQRCDVSYTYHRGRHGDYLKCHYCGKIISIPHICPACQKPYLKHFGIGTQQVEEQVKTYFPQARTLRMDYDTTRGKEGHVRILKAFADHEADILVGTQMIAKGLDFKNVTLVGVVAADSSLYFQDYRSPERTFELITQVAGRAGRSAASGLAIVQTYHPQHFAITRGAAQDYAGFYKEEILNRRIAQFPPFAVFFRVLFTGREQETLRAAHVARDTVLRHLKERGVKALSFEAGPAPIARRNDVYRSQLLLKLEDSEESRAVMEELYSIVEKIPRENCTVSIEINPQNMY